MAARYPEELKEQAREMRRAGMSVMQIVGRLGAPSRRTVQEWVEGVPRPGWTRRPNAKDAQRRQARELRTRGTMVPEIASALGVSKSSVSLWVRDLPSPERRRSAGEQARRAGHLAYCDRRRAEVAVLRAQEKQAMAESIGDLTEREILIAGAVAYWAEGTKAKPWRPEERVTFVNSDPMLVRLFLEFLDRLGVAPDRLRFHVHIHESADVPAAEAYWAELVGGDRDRFLKTSLKQHRPKTNRRNVDEAYRGCLTIRVLKSGGLYRQIEGIWWAVSGARASSLGPLSRVV